MDEASALLQLQDLDLEILRAERALDELPEKKAILEVRAKKREVEELKHKADVLVSKLEAETRRMQDELDSVGEKIEAEQAKIMSGEIADHKQVQIISRELDSLKRRKDKLEMDMLTTMERIEKAAGQKAKVDEAIAQLATLEESQVDRFKEHGGELQNKIAKATKTRAKIVATLSPERLAQYESLREQKSGIAVGRLQEGSCTACRVQLPAGAVAMLEHGEDVGVCPQCHRLIIVREGPAG